MTKETKIKSEIQNAPTWDDLPKLFDSLIELTREIIFYYIPRWYPSDKDARREAKYFASTWWVVKEKSWDGQWQKYLVTLYQPVTKYTRVLEVQVRNKRLAYALREGEKISFTYVHKFIWPTPDTSDFLFIIS